MLNDATINRILGHLQALRIGVIGDLFLDRYFDIDASLTELSIETGLDAYQIMAVRSYPGAAGVADTGLNSYSSTGAVRSAVRSIKCA